MWQVTYLKLTCGQVTIKYECMKWKFPKQHSKLTMGITNFVIPFRLTIYQTHFNVLHCAMNAVLHPFLWKSMLVFSINIFVYSRTWETLAKEWFTSMIVFAINISVCQPLLKRWSFRERWGDFLGLSLILSKAGLLLWTHIKQTPIWAGLCQE